MSRIYGNRFLRSIALATCTLAGVTACQNDGPIGPQTLPGARRPDAAIIVKPKPQLYFNGILFTGTQDHAKGEIYSMNPDGSSLFRLTTDTLADGYPDVSPTGPAFVWARSSPDGKTSELFTQNLDGSKRKQLTSLGALTQFPRYSPDGTKIAFSSYLPGTGSEIFVMNADGTGIVQLTSTFGTAYGPSWSPDGSKLSYAARDNAGITAVWTMTASGGQKTLLVTCDASGGCVRPKWSATGNEIAVERFDGTGIFIVDATSGAQTGYVPSSPGDYDMGPTWSKDGQTLIFSSKRSGNGSWDLYAAQPVRGGATAPPPVVHLTTSAPGNEWSPAYSR